MIDSKFKNSLKWKDANSQSNTPKTDNLGSTDADSDFSAALVRQNNMERKTKIGYDWQQASHELDCSDDEDY